MSPEAASSDALCALTGRVVTMNDSFGVLERGTVYIQGGAISAVQDAAQPPPSQFTGITATDTGGTIYPGLIELHNHLSYNALQLWSVPQRFGDRSQWAGTPQYQQLITVPMQIIGSSTALLPAVVRYVESKCIVAGVTTSQGIALFSNAGARRFYRGTLRVVEEPGDPALPSAGTRIADVVAADRAAFLKELGQRQCFLLHLSEGVDAAARAHFQSLQFPDGSWAITNSLAGIHSVALQQPDWHDMAAHGAAAVWSPLSNLLLYGGTADIATARAEGVHVGLGSDWSPSGSKNLLGELKVARIYAQHAGVGLTDRDVVAMATKEAATILRWDTRLGSIETGKLADLLVIDGSGGDPYAALLTARETALKLVVIAGKPRFGDSALMKSLGASGETVSIGGQARTLDVTQSAEDPAVASISLASATAQLSDALARLPELAKAPPQMAPPGAPGERWQLALDELSNTGMDLRPALTPAMDARPVAAAPPLPVKALQLDALTVADDAHFLDNLQAEPNLPPFLVSALRALYQ